MKLTQSLISLPRVAKRAISVAIDVAGLLLVAVLAIWLRFGDASVNLTPYFWAILALPFLAVPLFIVHGLYRAVIRYIGFNFASTVFSTVTLAFLAWTALIFMLDLKYPRSAIVIAWLLSLLMIFTTRFAARRLLFMQASNRLARLNRKNVVIFGAGSAGRQLLNSIMKIPHIYVVGLVDDSADLHRQEISSVKVYCREGFKKLLATQTVTDVYLAIPSLSRTKRQEIIDWLEPFPVKVSTIPGIDEIVSGKVSFADVREVEIEDLLGRESVEPVGSLLERCITDKVVMITGAGGSIGSQLCRQVLKQKPKVLVLFELSEFALYQIEQELKTTALSQQTQWVALLGNVQDEGKLRRVYAHYGVETVYHAAAYKHVPMVEHNIREGIYNNTFGTYRAAKSAAECGVKNFVLVSTDKAVRPTNVMGASKRLAEMALQALQQEYAQTRFVMVRFGNVLGSSGSVIPLFRQQIAEGGPVTVTHREITRYFMTIPEAASLVIQAGSMGVGGDVFVLDMGEPIKIDTLARRVIHLSGLQVKDEAGAGDIEICYTGLRPGEKLYEELLIGEDVDGTEHPRIMKAHEEYLSHGELRRAFDDLEAKLERFECEAVLADLKILVHGFHHTSKVVDCLCEG